MAALLFVANPYVSRREYDLCAATVNDESPRLFTRSVCTNVFVGRACLECVAKGRVGSCSYYDAGGFEESCIFCFLVQC
jgi:hypothetical protein